MNYQKTIRDFEKNYDKKYVVRLKELKNIFKEKSAEDENKIVYEVFRKKLSPMGLALTVINPGTVKDEFFMTKGHIHRKKTPEMYILLEGKGILLLQKNVPQVINLKKGEITLVPENYAHRLVNTGDKKLKVLNIYDENSKPDYNVKFKKRFFGK